MKKSIVLVNNQKIIKNLKQDFSIPVLRKFAANAILGRYKDVEIIPTAIKEKVLAMDNEAMMIVAAIDFFGYIDLDNNINEIVGQKVINLLTLKSAIGFQDRIDTSYGTKSAIGLGAILNVMIFGTTDNVFFGKNIVELLQLPLTNGYTDRYNTTGGTKTALGLGNTIKDIFEKEINIRSNVKD